MKVKVYRNKLKKKKSSFEGHYPGKGEDGKVELAPMPKETKRKMYNPRTGITKDSKGEPMYDREYDLGGAKKEFLKERNPKTRKRLKEILKRYKKMGY
jgi:hypothetical protein